MNDVQDRVLTHFYSKRVPSHEVTSQFRNENLHLLIGAWFDIPVFGV